MDITKKDYKETLQIEQRRTNDWQSLMKEVEELENPKKSRKRKKKR